MGKSAVVKKSQNVVVGDLLICGPDVPPVLVAAVEVTDSGVNITAQGETFGVPLDVFVGCEVTVQ